MSLLYWVNTVKGQLNNCVTTFIIHFKYVTLKWAHPQRHLFWNNQILLQVVVLLSEKKKQKNKLMYPQLKLMVIYVLKSTGFCTLRESRITIWLGHFSEVWHNYFASICICICDMRFGIILKKPAKDTIAQWGNWVSSVIKCLFKVDFFALSCNYLLVLFM